MDRIVECVPNFSEGRNMETVEALAAAVRSVPGVVLLDKQSDEDHHRSVLTFVGAPESVAEAAFLAAHVALQRIDMTLHHGEHPRVGATDVIPFVPIAGITLDECVKVVRNLGRRIADELRVPVFLYEQAATAPFRTHIEDIRREGLDGLAERMRTDPQWAPDFGDAKPHRTAGATIVGARRPLIAYNVNLATENLDLARAIARKVRASNGGLPSVKAVGIALKGRNMVQVSMNLTNYKETPLQKAFEAVKSEAATHQVSVHSSEIVGLIPEEAVAQVVGHHLHLENFHSDQVLEARIAKALTTDVSAAVGVFLEAVSATTPAPAGGSVAAMAGAAAMSLGVMVAGILYEKEKAPEKIKDLTAKRSRLIQLRDSLQAAIHEDAEAYGAVMKALQRPQIDPDREAAIQDTLRLAIAVPLAIVDWTVEGMEILREIVPMATVHMAADLRVGVLLSQAAGTAAISTVKTNAEGVKNDARLHSLLNSLMSFEERLQKR